MVLWYCAYGMREVIGLGLQGKSCVVYTSPMYQIGQYSYGCTRKKDYIVRYRSFRM